MVKGLKHACGPFKLSDDKTYWTCAKCGKVWPILITKEEKKNEKTS